MQEIDRFAFYAGSLKNISHAEYSVSDWASGLVLPTAVANMGAEEREILIPRSFGKHNGWLLFNYLDQVMFLFKNFSSKSRAFMFKHGDVTEDLHIPSFAKTRPAGSSGAAVLLKLNADRHWPQDKFKEVKAGDKPFREKRPAIVWRGVASGHWFANPELADSDYQSARYHLFRRWGDAQVDWLDIGVTKLQRLMTNPEAGYLSADYVERFIKPSMSVSQQLDCKFILVPEGKDVATGLKWVLNSQSVVMMPKPTVSSWLMEEKLEPWVHFVPIKTDFSDLEEKFDIALKDVSLCESIVQNANKYMLQFASPKQEANLQKKLIEHYLQKVAFKVDGEKFRSRFEADNVKWV